MQEAIREACGSGGQILHEGTSTRIRAWMIVVPKKWAEETRAKRPVQHLYEDRFAWRLRFERTGEPFEIASGHGMLKWTYDGERIERPVLVTRAGFRRRP